MKRAAVEQASSSAAAKTVKMGNNSLLYTSNQPAPVLHPKANTRDADLILKVHKSDPGTTICIIPLEKEVICNVLPYFATRCANCTGKIELDITVPRLRNEQTLCDFFTAAYV